MPRHLTVGLAAETDDAGQTGKQDPTLWEFATVLRRRRRLIAWVTLLGTALVSTGAFLLQPQYTAKAQLVVERRTPSSDTGQQPIESGPAALALVLTQMAALQSHDQLVRVLDSLLEDADYRAAQQAVPPHRFEVELRQHMLAGLQSAGVIGWLKERQLWSQTAPQDLDLRELQRRLRIFQELGSQVVSVSFTSTNPEVAALVANRAAQLYVQVKTDEKLASTDRGLAWIDERIPALESEGRMLEAELREYKGTQHLTDISGAAVDDQRLADLNRQLGVAVSERDASLARLAMTRRQSPGASSLLAVPEPSSIMELRRQELTLTQSRADLSGTLASNHPKLQHINNQLLEVRQAIAREVDHVTANLENETRILVDRVAAIRQRLAALQSGSTDPRLRQLDREMATNRQLYENLLKRGEALREQRQTAIPDVRLLSLAPVPDRPSSTNPLFFVPPAMIAMLVCGAFLAVLMERLDGTIRSDADVEGLLGLPCLGLVPRIHRSRRMRPHQYLKNKPFSPYAETIRSIAATLQLAEPNREPKVILVSSSVPGEGKTTFAVSLAVYAALLGRRVLLLDLDFRHPTVLGELRRNVSSGAIDLLHGSGTAADAIQNIPDLGLDILPIQRQSIDPVLLFAGDQMSRLLDRLRAEYDCIIIDSAPVLAITESRLLAAMADKVIFLVKWASTRRDIVRNALSLLRNTAMLDSRRPSLAGVVLTQVDLKKHARFRFGDSGEFFHAYKNYYAARRLSR